MEQSDLKTLRMPQGELLVYRSGDPRSIDLITRLRRSQRPIARLGLGLLRSSKLAGSALSALSAPGAGTQDAYRDALEAMHALLDEELGPFALSISDDLVRVTAVLRLGSGQTVFVKARSQGGWVLNDLATFTAEFCPGCPDSIVIPEVLHFGTLGQWTIAVLSDVSGTASTSHPSLPDVLPFLEDLAAMACAEQRTDDVLERVSTSAPELPAATAALIQLLRRAWTNETVRTTLAHGDFVPWNLCISGERAHIWDWDKHIHHAPWPYDAIHYLLQTRRWVRGEQLRGALDGALTDVQHYASALRMPSSPRDSLVALAVYAACRSANEWRMDRVSTDGTWLVEAVSERLAAEGPGG